MRSSTFSALFPVFLLLLRGLSGVRPPVEADAGFIPFVARLGGLEFNTTVCRGCLKLVH